MLCVKKSRFNAICPGSGPVQRRTRGGVVIKFNALPAVTHYQQNYYDVDMKQQYRSKCSVGRPSKKFLKYIVNYIFLNFLHKHICSLILNPRGEENQQNISLWLIATYDYRGETNERFLQLKAGTFMWTRVAGISVANKHKVDKTAWKMQMVQQNGRRMTFFLVAAFEMYNFSDIPHL